MPSEVKKRKSAKSAESKATESPSDEKVKKSRPDSPNKKDEKKKEEEISDPPPKFGPMLPISKQRLWSRTALILGLMTIVWWNSNKGNEVELAKFDERISSRGFKTKCSDSLQDAVKPFVGCLPKHCGRMISDELISPEEMLPLLDLAKRTFKSVTVQGGSSIMDLHTGFLTYEEKFIDLYKLNASRKIFKPEDLLVYQAIKTKLRRAISQYFGVDYWALHLTFPTYFSRFTEKPSKSRKDEYWHPTVHQEHYDYFHYSSVLFLSDLGKDFQNGRWVFIDGDNTNRTVDPKQGRAIVFTSGDENKHYIEKVSSGVRYALTVGFTCEPKKAIKDPKL